MAKAKAATEDRASDARRVALLRAEATRSVARLTDEQRKLIAEELRSYETLMTAAPTIADGSLIGDEWLARVEPTDGGLWGEGSEIVLGSGESLIIVSPTGLGKTTLAQRLVLARIGVGPAEVLGYPVATSEKPVLYLAMDRSMQAARSMRRMTSVKLGARLKVHGPLRFRAAAEPERFVDEVAETGAGMVVIDSLKDMGGALSDETVGEALNRAFQSLLAEGVEVVVLHHLRKRAAGEESDRGRISTIDRIYGSSLLMNGAGSILSIERAYRDRYELTIHNDPKQVAELVEVKAELDIETGAFAVTRTTPLTLLREDGPMTTSALASALHGNAERASLGRTRRAVQKLVEAGKVARVPGGNARGGRREDRWQLV